MLAAGLLLAACLQPPARAQAPAAALLLPEFAGQANRSLDFSRFSPDATPPAQTGPHIVAVGSLGAPAAIVALAPLLNAIRATRAVFYAGSVPVHIYGSKSENNLGLTGWFLQLYPEGAPDELFFNGASMARVLVKFWGSSRLQINGREFDIHLDIDITNPQSSRLEIDPKKPSGPRISFTAGELAKDSYETGYPIRLGGTEYRVFYGRGFLSNGEQFSGYSGNRSVVFMFRNGKDFSAYSIYEKNIPHDGILVSTPPKSLADDKKVPGDLTVGLRLDPGGNLEIYYPVRNP